MKWSIGRNKGKWNGGFWADQKDEIFVTFAVGCCIVILDDEALALYNYITNQQVAQMEHYYYLLVGPLVDLIYKMIDKR